MKRRFACLMATILLAISTPALAASNAATHFRPVPAGEQFQPRADRAYVVVKCVGGNGKCGIPMFLRLPTEDENRTFHAAKLEAWQKKGSKVPFEAFSFELRSMENLYSIDFKTALERDSNGSTYLIEADPGTYVIYGLGNKYSMMECLCLGTVEFSAKAGEVTAVGTFFYGRASEPSPYPELAEVTNLGPTFDMDFPLVSMALRTASATDTMPAKVQALPHTAAQLRAVGPFFEPTAREITRLAPIPGVLAYKRGTVIDIRSGQEAPGR